MFFKSSSSSSLLPAELATTTTTAYSAIRLPWDVQPQVPALMPVKPSLNRYADLVKVAYGYGLVWSMPPYRTTAYANQTLVGMRVGI